MPDTRTPSEVLQHAEALYKRLLLGRTTLRPSTPQENQAFLHYNHSAASFDPSDAQLGRAGLTPAAAAELLAGDTRLGDTILTKVGPGEHYRSVDTLCCCGEPLKVSTDTLSRHFYDRPSLFYPPFDGVEHSLRTKGDPALEYHPEGNSEDVQASISSYEGYPEVCPHITEELRNAFPSAYRTWSKVRSNVKEQARKGRLADIPAQWFRRDIGLLVFILDIGLPEKMGDSLHRINRRGKYSITDFYWGKARYNIPGSGETVPEVLPDTIDGRLAGSSRLLKQRYYTYKSRAATDGLPMGWENPVHFLLNLPKLPPDWTPEAYRLRFVDWHTRGFGPDNAYWQKTMKAAKAQRLRDDINRSLPANKVSLSMLLGSQDPGDLHARIEALSRLTREFMESDDRLVFPLSTGQAPFIPNHQPCVVTELFTLVRDAMATLDSHGNYVVKVGLPGTEEEEDESMG